MLLKLEWLGYRTVKKKLWQYVKPFRLIPERHWDRQTDRRTELLYQYRASVCWRTIKTAYPTFICLDSISADQQTIKQLPVSCNTRHKWRFYHAHQSVFIFDILIFFLFRVVDYALYVKLSYHIVAIFKLACSTDAQLKSRHINSDTFTNFNIHYDSLWQLAVVQMHNNANNSCFSLRL